MTGKTCKLYLLWQVICLGVLKTRLRVVTSAIFVSMILVTAVFAQTWTPQQGSTRDDYVVEWEETEPDYLQRKAEELKAKIIFDNCIIDLLPTDHSRPVLAAVTAKCRRISKDPTMFQKWKYSD